MLLCLCPDTVSNREALRLRKVPEQRLGRGMRVVPRGGIMSRAFWRIVFDQSLTRYILALAPFPLAMAIRPDLALGISQAPLLMFGLVYAIESLVLSVPTPEKRRALLDPDEIDRRLDRLAARGRDVLSRIAAAHGMQDERLHLVVEQSALRRIPVLTLVSVQVEGARGERPTMLALTAEDRATIAGRLFGEGLAEEDLHLANLATNVFLRDIPFEARAVSAHARLMAMAGRVRA